jgi:hypothetical protein
MRTSLHRVTVTIVVGLIVVARALGAGPTLVLTPRRPGQPPRDLHSRTNSTRIHG